MAEQRIVVTIDENGKINASTEGIKGERERLFCTLTCSRVHFLAGFMRDKGNFLVDNRARSLV
jgi:hypothetical protein